MGKLGVFQVVRETEFAPVKNANGAEGEAIVNDSPAQSRQMILKEASEWLSKAGVKLGEDAQDNVEVSFLLSYEGEGLDFLKDQEFNKPGYID